VGSQGTSQDNGLGSSSADTAEAKDVDLQDRYYDLDFSVRKSRRYHEKLCAFYGVWRDWVKIVTVLAGSGAFFLIFADAKHAAEILAAFVAAWAAIDYMVAPDKKAEKHRELCEAFIDLAKQIETTPRTEKAYRTLAAERLELEKAEPPCKRLVDLAARNDECRARDFSPEDLVPLNGWQRTFGYMFTFGMKRLEDWKAERQRQVRAAAV
jgi:hypothetical protein